MDKQENSEWLAESPLFKNLSEREVQQAMTCLNPKVKKYAKDKFIMHMGQRVQSLGLVVRGSVNVIQEDVWGNRNILVNLKPGDVFAETYAAAQIPLRVAVVTSEDSEIWLINIFKIINTCSQGCSFHQEISQNLLQTIALKNLSLNEKINVMSRKTIRARLMAYLSNEAQRLDKRMFKIPFSRQQLADYLCVERSALSHEISKMQQDGLIESEKSLFKLNVKEDDF